MKIKKNVKATPQKGAKTTRVSKKAILSASAEMNATTKRKAKKSPKLREVDEMPAEKEEMAQVVRGKKFVRKAKAKPVYAKVNVSAPEEIPPAPEVLPAPVTSQKMKRYLMQAARVDPMVAIDQLRERVNHSTRKGYSDRIEVSVAESKAARRRAIELDKSSGGQVHKAYAERPSPSAE